MLLADIGAPLAYGSGVTVGSVGGACAEDGRAVAVATAAADSGASGARACGTGDGLSAGACADATIEPAALQNAATKKSFDSRIDDIRLLDGRDVRSAFDDQYLSCRYGIGHGFGQKRGGERVAFSSDDEDGNFDVTQQVGRGVLPRGSQHPKEHRKVDVRHVKEVREHVLRVDPR